MLPSVDIDLVLRRYDRQHYMVELRCDLPNTAVTVDTLGITILLTFDQDRLAALVSNPAAYGLALGRMLLGDPLLVRKFSEARALAQRGQHPLRLRLAIAADAEELHMLRWETLRDPLTPPHTALAASEQVLFSRYLGGTDWEPPRTRAHHQLRALVIVADPDDLADYGLAPLDAAAEIALARTALGPARVTVLGKDERATLQELLLNLRDDYDLLYLLAHGRTDAEGETWLYLEDAQGCVAPVSGGELLEGLASLGLRPRLVVLGACESAGDAAGTDTLAALAPRLVQQGVPAVLAMQGRVTLETLQSLLPTFFNTLLQDGQIDRALAVARSQVRQRPDFWKPALFLRLKSGRLWEDPAGAGTPGVSPAVLDAPPPARPPEPLGFVGRAAELAVCERQLQHHGLMIISGMTGTGKTMLMATLARRLGRPERVFWHTFSAGETLDTLVLLLAGMLAHHGTPELWVLLQRTRQAGGQMPPLDVQISYLVRLVAGQGYLICLDDAHVLSADPRSQHLMGRLRSELNPTLQMIMTVHQVPTFAYESELTLLQGLSRADTQALLDARRLALDEALAEALYLQTGGHPQLLVLAIDALQRANRPERLIADLLEADHIERFLLNEVDGGLSDDEREVMRAVAALLDAGGTRYAVEALLERASLRRLLRGLCDRFLLRSEEGPEGLVYRQTTLVRTFYYGELSRRVRQELHQRAATYYGQEMSDPLRAAIHYERAGNPAQAADLVTGDLDTFISRGQGFALQTLLERLSAHDLDPARWVELMLARGRVLALFQPGETARACFQAVLDRLEGLPDSDARRVIRARACCEMGVLLEQGNPHQALRWYERGLLFLGDVSPSEAAVLHRWIGSALTSLGQLEAASAALERCLALLPAEATVMRARVQVNLGVLACQRGEMVRGETLFREALAVYERSGNRWREVSVRQNLALVLWMRGDWNSAAAMYGHAIPQAQALGLVLDHASLLNGLGLLQINQGLFDEAHATLAEALTQARQHQFGDLAVMIQLNLAEVALRRERWEQAEHLLIEAERQAEVLGQSIYAAEVARGRTQVLLARGEIGAALAEAARALAEARALEDPEAVGVSQWVCGRALLAAGQTEQALAAWAASADLLADYPYQQARTRLCWGAALRASDPAAAQALLEQARAVFVRLGAARDLALAEALLAEAPPLAV